jgi:acyl carrier protein
MQPAAEPEMMPGVSESEIKSRVRAFVQENFLYAMPDFELGDDDRLLERGVIDSMGVAEMIAFVESEFGISTSDDEVSEANYGSLTAIARFVLGKQQSPLG